MPGASSPPPRFSASFAVGNVLGRGIGFPPRVGADGRVVWSEGERNIRDSISLILLTEFGERVMVPDFGGDLGSFLFEANTASTHQLIADRIGKALARWEPRVTVENIAVEPDRSNDKVAIATIYYSLIATQLRERVTLSVTLSG